MCSETEGLESFAAPDVRIFRCPNRNDWGHAKRAEGIRRASCEWVGFFNHDDRYEPIYIEKMMAAGRSSDVAYCSWSESPACDFHTHQSTAGNFIVRTAKAREAGGWSGRDYEADGKFIEAVRSLPNLRIARVNDLLYFHNE